MSTEKPDLTRIWAATAPTANVVDPDVTTPGKVSAGWQAEIPPFEHFNFLQQWFTKGLAHFNEQGIGVWDVNTTYPVNGLAKGSDGVVYRAIQEQSGNDPVSDSGSNWLRYLTKVSLLEFGAVPDGSTDCTQALSDALDYVITNSPSVLYVPVGKYLLESSVTKAFGGDLDIAIVGENMYSSEFIVNSTDGGILLSSGARTSTVSFENFSVNANISRAGTALEYTVPEGGNQQARRALARNLNIGPVEFAGTSQSFEKGLVLEGMYRTFIDNVMVGSGSVGDATVGTVGISVNGTFKAHIQNCYVNDAFAVGISDVGSGGEGGYVYKTTVNGSTIGYKKLRDTFEPEVWLVDNHFNCTEVGCEFGRIKYGVIRGNLMYCQGDEVSNYVDFKIYSATGLQISDNMYRQPFAVDRVHVLMDSNDPTYGDTISDIYCDDKVLAATAKAYGEFRGSGTRVEVSLSRNISTEPFISYPDFNDMLIVGSNFTNVSLASFGRTIHYQNNAAQNPIRSLTKDSASPANADALGVDKFMGRNDAGEMVIYAQTKTNAIEVGDGIEEGNHEVFIMINGTLTPIGRWGASGLNLLSGAEYHINGNGGASGTFTAQSGETITVQGGIITGIV